MCNSVGRGLPFSKTEMDELFGPHKSLAELYSLFTVRMAATSTWTATELLEMEPGRMKKVLADRVAYVHCDLRPLNIMVHKGKFSGIIDWENSGWIARHWQLLVVRTPLPCTNPAALSRWWKTVTFEPEVEQAYEAGWELILDRV
jgi:aminoglycoside phosphotransferase (APT) family kinase protein